MATRLPSGTSLRRDLHAMPERVHDALAEHGLRAAYDARPAHQRNDYIGWILRARSEDTRLRRLQQMLSELSRGDCYMNMAWRPRTPQ